MRISTNTVFDQGLASLQQQTTKLMQVQQQISANRRMLTPADDPSAAARVLEVSQSQSISEQYDANIGAASDALSFEESVLAQIGALLQDAKDATNAAGNGAYSTSDLHSLAVELRGLYQQLMGLANSTDSTGQYLFSGYKSAIQPFSQTAPGIVSYNGDEGRRLMQVGPTRRIEVNDSGDGVFQRIPDGNGSFVTAASAGNTGAGLIDGGSALDTTKWNNVLNSKDYTIRFFASGANAAYDIVDNATGLSWITGATAGPARAFSSGSAVEFKRAGLQAFATGGANVTITGTPRAGDYFDVTGAVGGPVTAAAGGTNAGAAAVVAGAAAPTAWPANLRIKFDVTTGVPAVTTYDIIDVGTGNSVLTGSSPGAPYPRLYTSGSPIILDQAVVAALDLGAEVTISGVPQSGDTFTIAASTSQDVFKTLNDLVNLLESGAKGVKLANSLSGMQRNLTNAMENALTVRASIGSRLKELDGLKNGNDRLSLDYSQTLSRLQDLDYAKAASDFAQQQISLQAAQQSFVKVMGLSLFNYL